MNYFSHEQVTERIIRIRDLTGTALYLAEGRERACLLDTGTGIGNLREYVSQLTDKPLFVVLTHGHVDHAGGAGDFSDSPVYLHPADRTLMRVHTTVSQRLDYLNFTAHMTDMPEDMLASDFPPEKTLPLEHGQTFDLGDLTLEIIHTPGHTQGMCMVLLREERTILFGDGCGVSVMLLDEYASSVEEYLKSLQRLSKYESRYDHIIRNHGSCISGKELLGNVIECCQCILNGSDDREPARNLPVYYEDAVFAKALAEDKHSRKDGKEGNIAYRPCKIRKA